MHRLHREILGRLEHDGTLAAHPGDNGRPIFLVVSPARLAFLTAPTRPVPQRLLPALTCLALLARGVGEFIRLYGALSLPISLVRDGRMA